MVAEDQKKHAGGYFFLWFDSEGQFFMKAVWVFGQPADSLPVPCNVFYVGKGQRIRIGKTKTERMTGRGIIPTASDGIVDNIG